MAPVLPENIPILYPDPIFCQNHEPWLVTEFWFREDCHHLLPRYLCKSWLQLLDEMNKSLNQTLHTPSPSYKLFVCRSIEWLWKFKYPSISSLHLCDDVEESHRLSNEYWVSAPTSVLKQFSDWFYIWIDIVDLCLTVQWSCQFLATTTMKLPEQLKKWWWSPLNQLNHTVLHRTISMHLLKTSVKVTSESAEPLLIPTRKFFLICRHMMKP